jgi:Ca2+-binding EF-hand superfamily protein
MAELEPEPEPEPDATLAQGPVQAAEPEPEPEPEPAVRTLDKGRELEKVRGGGAQDEGDARSADATAAAESAVDVAEGGPTPAPQQAKGRSRPKGLTRRATRDAMDERLEKATAERVSTEERLLKERVVEVDASIAEMQATIRDLEAEMKKLSPEARGSAEESEMRQLIDVLTTQVTNAQQEGNSVAAMLKIAAFAGQQKRKRKQLKRQRKKTEKMEKAQGFFTDEYTQKQQREANIQAEMEAGERKLTKGDQASDAELAEAEAHFLKVLELDSSNINARVSLQKVSKMVEERRAAAKEARKMALMQKRYGSNWMNEMQSEQRCTGQDLKEIFELIDEDGSGLLDREELSVLADFFSDKPMSEAQLDAAMKEMDEDNSGEVDFDEFKQWWEQRTERVAAARDFQKAERERVRRELTGVARPVLKKQQRTGDIDVLDPRFEEKLRHVFERFDDDGSGEIDETELGLIFEALGHPMEPDELAALVKEVDEDGSGMIEFDEFLRMVQSSKMGGAAAAVLREQAFGEMDAEERYDWARGKILRFRNGVFHSVFSKDAFESALLSGATEPMMEFAEAEAAAKRARELGEAERERLQALEVFRKKEFSNNNGPH